MAGLFDDLYPTQQPATPSTGFFDDLYPKSQFANVQSGAATAAVPEKAWYEKAGTAVAEIPEAAYEGLQAGGSELGKWATLAASAPAMAYDAAKSALSGEATTEAQDWMFGNLVEPQDQAAQYNRNEIAKKGILGQVAGGVGQAVPDVALAMAGGSTLGAAKAAAPLVQAGASGLKQMLAESISVGVKTAAPLAEKAAAQRYGEAIAQGKSQGEATGEAIKAIATTTAMGLTGSGGVGRLGNTVASGLGGEVVREMEGRPFDPAELGVNLALGFGLSGPKQEAPTAPRPTAADEAMFAQADAIPEAVVPDALAPPADTPILDGYEAERQQTWGMFDDLLPQSTERPLEAPTSATEDTGVTQVAPDTEAAQNAVQSVLEGTTPEPLSPVAQRLKDANERSIQETGQPLSADEIRRIREEAPAQDEPLDLTPAELEAYQQWQRGQEETPEVSVDELSPADRALVERSMGAPDEAVSFLREESARQGDLDAEQSGLKTAVKSTLGDTEVTFLRDEDGLPPDVKTKPKADGTVRKGLYDPRTGKVYLFTGSGMTPQDAAFTAAHEIAGHKGLRSLAASEAKIGTKSAREWLDTSLSNALENPTVKAVADSMAAQRKSGDTILMAEEAMADMAAAVRTGDWAKLEAKHGVTVPEGVRAGVKGVVQKFVEQIRRLVNVTISKATGKKAKFTDAQVNELIENAWQAAKSGEEARTIEAPLEQTTGGTRQTQPSEATPDSNIVPEWQRRLKSVFSWKGGNRFANEYERAALEAATGDFLAERSAKLFDKAGFKKLSDNQKEMVRAALNGDKSAEAALPEKARNAVRFTRDEITNYQSKLASQGVKMDGVDLSDMLYDSMAKDNYTTRAYGVYEIKPTTIDRIAYAFSRAESRGVPFWRWRQEKKNPEVVQSMVRYIEENLIDPDSKRTPQEQTEDILNQLADPRGFAGSNLEVVRQAARDSSILMARDNVPAPIREYWGEFKDPRLQAAMTLSRLGALTAKQTMLNNIWKANAGKLFFEDGQQPKGFTAKLPDNHDYGPLAGKMTRPDIARMIETMTGVEKASPRKVQNEILNAVWDTYVQVNAHSKVAKTVLSAATNAANVMANTFLMTKVAVQQGLMFRPLGVPEFFKTLDVVTKDFLENLDPKTAKGLISDGIIRDSAQYGELRKMRSKYQREADRVGDGKLSKGVHLVTDALGKTFGKVADLYQIADNAARLHFFFGEMAIQKQLHPDWTHEQVREEARNRARDQVPTWGRAAPIVKFTSRAEGNFATWSAEVIRTFTNQVKYAVKDMVHGETIAQRRYGASQLVATATAIGIAKAAVPAIISYMFGFKSDDKEKNEAVSRIAPEYFGGDTLAVASADPKSGKIVFLNSTRLDPSAPFHQLWNREMQALKDDKSIPEATWGWVKDAFVTPGPLPSGAAAAITGENKFGQKLAPDERMKAVVDAFKPGTLVTAAKIDKLKKRGVDPRVIQAAQTGLPLYDFDASRAMYFSAMDFNNALREYRQQFNRGFGAAEATPEQQQAKYKEFLRNEKETFDKINNQVKALQTIFGDKEGKKIAMDAIEGAKIDKDYKAALVEGKFKPNNLEDSKTFLDTQEKNAIYADPKREKEIRKDFAERRRKLTQMRRNYQQLLND
jgi:hypothetical protein